MGDGSHLGVDGGRVTRPAPTVEKIGDQVYLDGGIWPFGEFMPLQCGFVEYEGMEVMWAITWSPMGTCLNGYARIPLEGHSWVAEYDHYDQLPVEVHGGLTYGPQTPMKKTEWELDGKSGKLPGIRGVSWAERGGWIGFDTAHTWDIWSEEEITRLELAYPGNLSEQALRLRGSASFSDLMRQVTHPEDPWNNYWTEDLVVSEAQMLALQVLAGRNIGPSDFIVGGDDAPS